jgi:GTP-sensing pleiotropic transcriptional regulator CodY
MTSSKTKGEVLSQTTKSYLQELAVEEVYGIRKEFSSRYTDKGNQVEELSIALCNDVLGLGFIYKNEEHFSNDWITGTPDVNTNEILLDVKSSWDATTFPFFDTELKNKEYFYQMQGYMWLTGKEESLLCYCLVDTPLQIVEDEIRREHWKANLIEESLDLREFVELKHIFTHIQKEKRLKAFKIAKDEKIIEEIKTRIEQCREYYDKLLANLK